MNREFSILYRRKDSQGSVGDVLSVKTEAACAEDLEHDFEKAGLHVVSIKPGRAIVDWNQPNFDRDEASEFFRIKKQTLSANKGGGQIPWAKIGLGIYPRRLLERYVDKQLNDAGKALLRDLH